jgi:hypothetical protein
VIALAGTAGLRKNDGATLWTDAGARSAQSFSLEADADAAVAGVSFQARQTDRNVMVGLAESANAEADFRTITLAVHMTNIGTLLIWHRGSVVTSIGRYTASTKIEVCSRAWGSGNALTSMLHASRPISYCLFFFSGLLFLSLLLYLFERQSAPKITRRGAGRRPAVR